MLGAVAVRTAGNRELALWYSQCGPQAMWEGGALATFRPASWTCGEVHTQRGELCWQQGLHQGEVSALSAAFTRLVGKTAEGGMLVRDMSLNPCSCTM